MSHIKLTRSNSQTCRVQVVVCKQCFQNVTAHQQMKTLKATTIWKWVRCSCTRVRTWKIVVLLSHTFAVSTVLWICIVCSRDVKV